MKIILIGASGTIGKTVKAELAQRHEIITAGRTTGDVLVDMTSRESIEAMYAQTGKVDAVVCTAGKAYFGPFEQAKESDFYTGVQSKLLGQVNLLHAGLDHVNDGGSFTFITGILADDPVLNSSCLAMVNGAVNAFVGAVAMELPRSIRANVVSPGLVEASVEKYKGAFPGHIPVSMEHVAAGFVKSVEGAATGQVIRIF